MKTLKQQNCKHDWVVNAKTFLKICRICAYCPDDEDLPDDEDDIIFDDVDDNGFNINDEELKQEETPQEAYERAMKGITKK